MRALVATGGRGSGGTGVRVVPVRTRVLATARRYAGVDGRHRYIPLATRRITVVLVGLAVLTFAASAVVMGAGSAGMNDAPVAQTSPFGTSPGDSGPVVVPAPTGVGGAERPPGTGPRVRPPAARPAHPVEPARPGPQEVGQPAGPVAPVVPVSGPRAGGATSSGGGATNGSGTAPPANRPPESAPAPPGDNQDQDGPVDAVLCRAAPDLPGCASGSGPLPLVLRAATMPRERQAAPTATDPTASDPTATDPTSANPSPAGPAGTDPAGDGARVPAVARRLIGTPNPDVALRGYTDTRRNEARPVCEGEPCRNQDRTSLTTNSGSRAGTAGGRCDRSRRRWSASPC